MKRYILTDCLAVRALNLNPGDIMEVCNDFDYGMAFDHERITGEPHINLWYAPNEYPFYTLPLSALEAA